MVLAAACRPAVPDLRPLPTDRAYVLRVAYWEDPRLPTLRKAEREELYAKVEALSKDWYGFSLDLREVEERGLREAFDDFKPVFEGYAFRDKLAPSIIDDPRRAEDYIRLLQTVLRDFKGRDLKSLRRYFPRAPEGTRDDLVRYATDRFVEALRDLRAIPLETGGTFFDPAWADTQDFLHWTGVVQNLERADFIVTNTMSASADEAMPVYVISRGGVSNGFVDNNPHNDYRGAGMIGLFPFLADARYIVQRRGTVPPGERLDLIATFWMHELGHLLLRLAEHYDHQGCVHVAPPGLRALSWHRAVRAKGRCPLEHKTLKRY